MRSFRTENNIQVYFLTDAQIIRNESIHLDINEARSRFKKDCTDAMNKNDKGTMVMRFASGDVIERRRIEPLAVDIADFNKRFGNL